MGQNGFDCACVSVVFLFLLCFIAHSYEANGGTDMEVLACFRSVFFSSSLFALDIRPINFLGQRTVPPRLSLLLLDVIQTKKLCACP